MFITSPPVSPSPNGAYNETRENLFGEGVGFERGLSHALLGESKKDWITLRYDYENMKGLVEKS